MVTASRCNLGLLPKLGLALVAGLIKEIFRRMLRPVYGGEDQLECILKAIWHGGDLLVTIFLSSSSYIL